MRVRFVVGLMLSCIVLFSTPMSVFLFAADASKTGSPLKKVRVAQVQEAWRDNELRFPAVVRPVDRTRLSFQVSGVLNERFPEIGHLVRQGDKVATLYNPRLEPAVEASKAQLAVLDENLAQLKRDIVRSEQLVARRLLGQQDLERTRSTHQAMLSERDMVYAQLTDAEALLEEANLYATHDGVIVSTPIETGEFIRAGTVIFELGATENLEVEVELPSSAARRLKKGQSIPLFFPDWKSLGIRGSVSDIGISGRQPGGLFPIVITFSSHDVLRSGMRVDVSIPVPEQFSIAVPLSAISDTGLGQPKIYQLINNRVQLVDVSLGRIKNEFISISGDLRVGDQIVITGHSSLTNGQRVQILPP